MLSASDIVIHAVSFDHPDSIHLRTTQRTEITALGGIDPGTPPTAADIPVFLVAYYAGIPVGCGGLRPLSSPPDSSLGDHASSNTAEIKRMFVDPSYRGPIGGDESSRASIAQLVLTRLEEEALRRSWTLLLLETGTFLTKARRFYERCGYVQRGMFGGYSEEDNSVCYEKRLFSKEMAAVHS